MTSLRLKALRDFFVRLDDALDRRPEDDIRDDISRLNGRVEALEARHPGDGSAA